MKATLDHVGIAVSDLPQALAFFRDALGLEVSLPEDVPSQRVRVRHLCTGPAELELLEATDPSSSIARFIEKRGPGLHHITLRVDDIDVALSLLTERGVRLIDSQARPGAGGSRVAFIHPSSAHGVLVELKEATGSRQTAADTSGRADRHRVRRMTLGDLELVSLSDGSFRLDGGAMFGVVPRPLWEKKAQPDDRNRIRLGLRPLLVLGEKRMLIDAGIGDKLDAKHAEMYGVEDPNHLESSLAAAGLEPADIDIVLATHLHFDHAGGFTRRESAGFAPRFPNAQYLIRRGEWEAAMTPSERTRASYQPESFLPLADRGLVRFIEEDQEIIPGVRVRRTGGHTEHHQLVEMSGGGRKAIFVGDLIPTTAHLADAWIMSYDLFPATTLEFKCGVVREAVDREHVILFEHDPEVAGGVIRLTGGKRTIEPCL